MEKLNKKVEVVFEKTKFNGQLNCYIRKYEKWKKEFNILYEIFIDKTFEEGVKEYTEIFNIKSYQDYNDVGIECSFEIRPDSKDVLIMNKKEYQLEQLAWNSETKQWVLHIKSHFYLLKK